MSRRTAPVRAVICDVYHTLLKVGPPPPDVAVRWDALWSRAFPVPAPGRKPAAAPPPPVSLADFNAACRVEITRDHALKKAAGVRFPEVDWRAVTVRAAPALATLPGGALDRFLTAHAALERACSAMPGAREFLSGIRARGLAAGIASNAQGYTLEEMRAAGLPPEDFFEPDLCFWSWREGFSKPDPGVFALLARRLAARGIAPHGTLMIGDRPDNDILPARAAGWKTWLFSGVWPDPMTL